MTLHIVEAVARGASELGRGLTLVLLAVGMVACGVESESSDPEASQTATSIATATTTTTATATQRDTTSTMLPAPAYARPDRLCGEPGFAYLLSVYFFPQCSQCHGGSDFAGADPRVAWPRLLALDEKKLIDVVLGGQFCVGACRLREGDATLIDLRAWLVEKSSCP